MRTLAEQQRQLRLAVQLDRSAPSLLLDGGGLLRIYQQAYTSRLVAALRDNYGLLPRLMGDEAFEALARAYVQDCPSPHPSIRWFGDELVDFMARHEDLVPHPAMLDLARMEWALRAAFDAADAPPLQAAELARLAPEAWATLVFAFQPSLQYLALDWAIEPAWRALQAAGEDDEPALDEPEAHAHVLLVWRPQLDTRWRSASSPLEAQLLAAAMSGSTFGALCALAAAALGEEQAPPAVIAALQQWLAEGLLTA